MNTRIEFCCGKKNCPTVEKVAENTFHIGGPEEGISIWNKQNLQDFVKAAKEGQFDEMINDDTTGD